MVPLDFIEEVERAEAACDKGWLRVIAEDLRGERFQWDGLRRVAQSQWNVRDMDGARVSWEALRRAMGADVGRTGAGQPLRARLSRERSGGGARGVEPGYSAGACLGPPTRRSAPRPSH
jgi:hypothetical protein